MKYFLRFYIPVFLFYMFFGILYVINIFKSGKKEFSLNFVEGVRISIRSGSLVAKIFLILHYVTAFLAFVFVVLTLLHTK